MSISDRLIFASLGALFGSLIGVACWWLYGLGHSWSFSGPGIDPVLKHWLTFVGGGFAGGGFIWGERVADAVGGAISAIFNFETNQTPSDQWSSYAMLFTLLILLAAVWFMVPR